MASARISAPMRGVAYQMGRLSIRQGAICSRCTKSLCTPFARSISTSTSPKASVSSIITSADGYVPVKPLSEQTVLATIHQFPSLEPLRFETYPANHLHLPTRRDILHRAVIYEGDMTRLGTASTKTRHEVQGSRRKIRPQKGSGRARLGDKNSPMLRGGGVAFGPKPRDFSSELPKKVYDLAWRTALSYRFRKGELIIVDNAMEIESPSPRLLGDIFKHHEKLRGKGRSLLVTLEERPLLEQALVEMDRGEQTLTWEEVDVKNLLELSRVIIERDALHNILLTHEEDLTHKTLQPWHKSLIRSSPPTHLEATIGWPEFRALALTHPKDKDAVRAEAYESVVSTRYEYAQTLPQSPKRTELTVSAYNLLAEAKELQFKEKTGLPFSDYTAGVETEKFPRIQALDYQIRVKSDLANTTAETSREEGEEIVIEVRKLEVQKWEIQHEAALLAAQIHEHRSAALKLGGEESEAEDLLVLASEQRGDVEDAEMAVLQSKLEVAKQKVLVASLKGHFDGQQKAQEEVRQCTQAVEEKQAAIEAEGADLGEDVEEVEIPEGVESPKLEAVREEKR
ncbi:50S ribosomal protein-like protein L4 [Clathrospora elynae]|uniref:Large ribosomal subunit protein uL4m n=1 Tax=Clathrospora elynae TaxID=706981 RepID=A0A6A5SFC6_9PLEO|nr:50S ribosomal protein-like protein L4 [Clathrospora elynae]